MSPSKIRNRRPIRSGKNSTRIEKIGEKLHDFFVHVFGSKIADIAIGVVTSLAVIFAGVFWFNRAYADPERAFWGTISNNLSTYGVTREVNQQGANELTQIVFGAQVAVRDIRTVTTTSDHGTGRVTVESIGTPKNTYQHYILIDQPAQNGKQKPDYTKIYPLWLRSGDSLQGDSAQLFNSSVFGAVLFGNMPSSARTETINQLRKAYKINFDKVDRNAGKGRRIYSYDATINLREYIKAAQIYAKNIGLPNASQIKPSNYKSTDQLSVNMQVDVKSRQLKKISYKSSDNTEEYSGYGVASIFSPPSETVSYETLQKAIENIEQ